jgi:hypothetical protein
MGFFTPRSNVLFLSHDLVLHISISLTDGIEAYTYELVKTISFLNVNHIELMFN